MRKLLVLAILALFTVSCKTEFDKMEPVSYWSDSSGMALFEVKKGEGSAFSISSTLGILNGTVSGNSIRGLTDLKDSFSLEVDGDNAKYSILGISIDYHKIAKNQYDSLTKALTAN